MSESGPEVVVLTYELRNTRPVELADLLASLTALGEQYWSFLRRRGVAVEEDRFRLYVRESRAGSIIIDFLTDVAPGIPTLLAQFATDLNDWFEAMKGLKDIGFLLLGKPESEVQQVGDIIKPVAKNNGAVMNFIAKDGGTIIVQSSINSAEAGAGRERLRVVERQRFLPAAARASISEPEVEHHFRNAQAFRWVQVSASGTGNKGIISQIHPKPVKVVLASSEIRNEMIDSRNNPLRAAFTVDVEVTTRNGRPSLYMITRVMKVLALV